MLSADKTGLLKTFLGSLPGHIAVRLAMAVETDRLMDGNLLPHDAILESLRPVLRREHYVRTLTPLRMFCRPFQDLLDYAPRAAKLKGVVARTSIVPVWNWLTQTLIPAEADAYLNDSKALILSHKTQEAIACAARFWPVASAAMRTVLQDPRQREALVKSLGSALAVEDADEMALLLAAGDHVEALAALLQPKTPCFTEPLVWQVREVYERLEREQPDAAPYAAVIAMNRLAKPWEALRLPMLVTRKMDDTLISSTDMGVVGDILFCRMDELKTAIQITRHPLFDADTLMAQVQAFTELSRNLAKEIELKRDGDWGKRLLAERAMIGQVMETFMDRAPRELAAAMPTQKSTGADFSKPINAEKKEMALRYARLVAKSRDFAAAASFAAKQKTVYEELSFQLTRYNDDVVVALKADPAHPVANAQLQLCVDLTALLFSAEEAELLQRRGRAAAQVAA